MRNLIVHLQFMLAAMLLVSLFFSRLLASIGFPSPINFIHLGLLPIALAFAFLNLRQQHQGMFFAIIGFGAACILSGIANNAGSINVALMFLIMVEPFILYLLLTNKGWRKSGLRYMQKALVGTLVIHFTMIAYQAVALGLRHDDVRGLFIGMTAAAHLCGGIAVYLAIYFSWIHKNQLKTHLLGGIWALALLTVWVADAKQTVIGLILTLIIASIVQYKRPWRAGASSIFAIVSLYWLSANITMLRNIDWIDRVTEGLSLKLGVLPMIWHEFQHELQFLVGLGPGHSISRVAIILPKYEWLERYLDMTIHPLTEIVNQINAEHWLTNSESGSSIYSLYNSWFAIWGDVGLIGLLSYLLLWLLLFRDQQKSAGAQLLIAYTCLLGAIFFYLGEPSFTGLLVWILAVVFHGRAHTPQKGESEILQ